MSRLAPHLTLAWRLGQDMSEPRLRLAAADRHAVSSRAALILLRTDRTIAFADKAGEELLAVEEWCRLDRLGRFAFRDALRERALAMAMRELARSEAPVTLRTPGGESCPAVHLVSLEYEDVRDWPLATLLNLPQRSLLCAIERSAAAKKAPHLAVFDLTKAEQEVADAIARGENTTLIAERRGVSLTTIRSQVQAIYTKCGVNNRAALAALVLNARRSD